MNSIEIINNSAEDAKIKLNKTIIFKVSNTITGENYIGASAKKIKALKKYHKTLYEKYKQNNKKFISLYIIFISNHYEYEILEEIEGLNINDISLLKLKYIESSNNNINQHIPTGISTLTILDTYSKNYYKKYKSKILIKQADYREKLKEKVEPVIYTDAYLELVRRLY